MHEEPIVKCRGVTKIYGAGALEVRALDNVDFDILPGDFATLAGPSGSGKTTLLNMIGALDRPTSGSVTIGGTPLSDMSDGALADLRLTKIGFVFQSYNLIPVLSARENIEFVLQLRHVPAEERRDRALEALHDVGLDGLGDRRPGAMSGGQQQRVAVARALVTRPDIVLADEPTANLDSENAHGLVDLMYTLNQQHGTTFLMGTHDMRLLEHSQRRIEMRDGRIENDARA